METLIVVCICVIVCCTLLIGVYLVCICDGELSVDRRKLWLVIFLFGPASWLGAGAAKIFLLADKYSDNIAGWFRRSNEKD